MTKNSNKAKAIGIIEEYIEKISLRSGHSEEEILKKITQKKKEKKGMTDIGALYAIKNELGLDFSIKSRDHLIAYKMRDEDKNAVLRQKIALRQLRKIEEATSLYNIWKSDDEVPPKSLKDVDHKYV